MHYLKEEKGYFEYNIKIVNLFTLEKILKYYQLKFESRNKILYSFKSIINQHQKMSQKYLP